MKMKYTYRESGHSRESVVRTCIKSQFLISYQNEILEIKNGDQNEIPEIKIRDVNYMCIECLTLQILLELNNPNKEAGF